MDNTKYANTQTTQIALISPGSTVCMYKNYIRKDESQTNIQKYIFGSDEVYNFSSTSIDSTAKTVCRTYIFGTDKYGRDVYSRIVIGIRYPLILALCSVITALIIGIILGALAGYF